MSKGLCIGASAALIGAGSALAGVVGGADGPGDFSVVNPSSIPTELTHEQILNMVYGGAFSPSSSFSGGTNPLGGGFTTVTGQFSGSLKSAGVKATRVQDRGGTGLLHLLTGSAGGTADDQRWADGLVQIRAEAKYAVDSASFGWADDTAGGAQSTLFADTAAVGTSVVATLSSNFRWFLHNKSLGSTVFSRESDNFGVGAFGGLNFDQLVTYEITGLGDGVKRWLLFFEDRLRGQDPTDYDYNDSVIEITVIPLPPAVYAGAASLAALAGFRALRRWRTPR